MLHREPETETERERARARERDPAREPERALERELERISVALSGSLWLSLILSDSLWLSPDLLTKPLLGLQGLYSACSVATTLVRYSFLLFQSISVFKEAT